MNILVRLHDDIHNYYEKIVLEEILKRQLEKHYSEDIMADFCCTVLNQLPARYIRYDVDMEFYLPLAERTHIQERVNIAIDVAISQIAKKRSLDD